MCIKRISFRIIYTGSMRPGEFINVYKKRIKIKILYFVQGYVYPLICPYVYGLMMISHTGGIFTTVAVSMERCITVCAPFTMIKVITRY